jgi:hypothetical protein
MLPAGVQLFSVLRCRLCSFPCLDIADVEKDRSDARRLIGAGGGGSPDTTLYLCRLCTWLDPATLIATDHLRRRHVQEVTGSA